MGYPVREKLLFLHKKLVAKFLEPAVLPELFQKCVHFSLELGVGEP